MKTYKKYSVKLNKKTYIFYTELANYFEIPIKYLLSDVLHLTAWKMMSKAYEEKNKEQQ